MEQAAKNEKMSSQFYDIAEPGEVDADTFPKLTNISAGMIFNTVVRPLEPTPSEYIYVDTKTRDRDEEIKIDLAIAEWNIMWEMAQLRYDAFEDKLPPALSWLNIYRNHNITLLPRMGNFRYHTYAPLFHLLPESVILRKGLPPVKVGVWPFMMTKQSSKYFPRNFDENLSAAFASHIWPLLSPGARLSAFSKNEPIKILAHNLDFWLPYAIEAIQDRLRSYGRVEVENSKIAAWIKRNNRKLPVGMKADTPLRGGIIWQGEEEAWAVTEEIIERADKGSKIRSIIDAIKSNRVHDDFSPIWSFAREDFERKLYAKRRKIKVTFVELNDTIPVHGPESELHENLLWQDFMALLNHKEKSIVVLLRSGFTKLGDIGNRLGYASHSPVSKSLAKIRQKARLFFEQS